MIAIPAGFIVQTKDKRTRAIFCATCLQKARMRNGEVFCPDGEKHRPKKETG